MANRGASFRRWPLRQAGDHRRDAASLRLAWVQRGMNRVEIVLADEEREQLSDGGEIGRRKKTPSSMAPSRKTQTRSSVDAFARSARVRGRRRPGCCCRRPILPMKPRRCGSIRCIEPPLPAGATATCRDFGDHRRQAAALGQIVGGPRCVLTARSVRHRVSATPQRHFPPDRRASNSGFSSRCSGGRFPPMPRMRSIMERAA